MNAGSRALVATLLFALATTGCYKQTFTNYTVPPGGPEESQTRVYGVFGLIGDPEIDVRSMCKTEARQITWSAGPLDILVSVVTLGLVGLRTIAVECSATTPPPGGPR